MKQSEAAVWKCLIYLGLIPFHPFHFSRLQLYTWWTRMSLSDWIRDFYLCNWAGNRTGSASHCDWFRYKCFGFVRLYDCTSCYETPQWVQTPKYTGSMGYCINVKIKANPLYVQRLNCIFFSTSTITLIQLHELNSSVQRSMADFKG